jgi:hypothetical protein
MSLKQAFALWYLGNERTCTGPYRLIGEKHRPASTTNMDRYRKDVSNARRAMKKLYSIALEQYIAQNPTRPNPASSFRITKDNWCAIYDNAFEALQNEIYSNASSKDDRTSQVTVNSVCNQLGKYERIVKERGRN